jgi:hypothetical protein
MQPSVQQALWMLQAAGTGGVNPGGFGGGMGGGFAISLRELTDNG